jgi:tripartite-type tricarboxylate transporter receptor subunit TctC
VKDFTPIVGLFSVPNVLVVPAALNVSTVAELKALAATKKGGLAYGSQGIGSGGHLLGAMLQTGFGVPMEHVAYKGGAPLTLDLVAARVDLAFNSYSTVKQYVAEGRLRVLAVASPQRFAKLPDIPTMAEAGYPGIEMDTWYGLVGPTGMPKAVVTKLNSEFAAASRQPALLKRLDEIDAQAIAGTPEQFAAWLASEADRLGKIARANNVRAD